MEFHTLVMWTNADETHIMALEDEPNFILNHFDGHEPSMNSWDREEVNGPITISHPVATAGSTFAQE